MRLSIAASMLGCFVQLSEGLTPSLRRTTAVARESTAKLPHILFILLDDLGWSETGFNAEGSTIVPTPHMDALAAEGVILKRHYVHKFCSPTRSAIQSGRAPIHVNVQNAEIESRNSEDPQGGFAGIPRNMTGIASVMKKAGYKTHMVGKWDIGVATPDHLPVGRGYDTSLIYFEHTNDYWKYRSNVRCGHLDDLWEHNASIPFPGRPAVELMNRDECSRDTQLPGCVFEDALFESRVKQIIHEHDKVDPLFLFWATHAVHGPYEPPDESVVELENLMKGADTWGWVSKRKPYYATLLFIDQAIGRVMQAVKDRGLYDEMLIVLSSDNGAVAGMSNEPLRGAKFTNFDGGIRAVSLVSGGFLPKNVRGSTSRGLIAAQDWYATFAGLAGVDPADHRAAAAGLPPVDSLDMWPFLSGKTDSSPRERIEIGSTEGGYSTMARRSGTPMVGGIVAQIQGSLYKLVIGEADGDKIECDMRFGPTIHDVEHPAGFNPDRDCPLSTRVCGSTPENGCLYNLDDDPTESKSVAASETEVFKQLLDEARQMSKAVYKPNRGEVKDQDCKAMGALHGEHLGPFFLSS